jgi:hypothetical protein
MSFPFILGSVFLPEPRFVCDKLGGIEGGVSSTSEGDVLLRLPGPSSVDAWDENGSNRTGGGDDKGDELGGISESFK